MRDLDRWSGHNGVPTLERGNEPKAPLCSCTKGMGYPCIRDRSHFLLLTPTYASWWQGERI